jgi:hypothetical protein
VAYGDLDGDGYGADAVDDTVGVCNRCFCSLDIWLLPGIFGSFWVRFTGRGICCFCVLLGRGGAGAATGIVAGDGRGDAGVFMISGTYRVRESIQMSLPHFILFYFS